MTGLKNEWVECENNWKDWMKRFQRKGVRKMIVGKLLKVYDGGHTRRPRLKIVCET